MSHLSRKAQVLCPVTVAIVFFCIIRFAASATTAQASPSLEHIPTTETPKITVHGPSYVSITEWDKSEVSITPGPEGDISSGIDVRLKPEKDQMEIRFAASRAIRTNSINLVVPKKALVILNTHDCKIEIRDPLEATAVLLTNRTIEMSVPLNSKIDLRAVDSATWYGPAGYSRNSVGRKLVGQGPPYLKLSMTNDQVIITPPRTINAGGGRSRPLTIAAQMIALRGGLMGTSIRKSEPRLSNLKKEVSPGASPKDDDPSDVTLRSQLVNLNVSVTDRDGRAIAGLKAEDFSIYEDGILQTISHFQPERSPFNLVLLLDMSGSVASKRDLIIEAALHFIDVIGPEDKVAVVTFTTDVLVVSHLTQDRGELRDNITNLVFPTGGTSFYDALGYSMAEELRKVRKQRNAIVVLTDGEDNGLVYQNLAQFQSQPALANIVRGASQPIGSFLTFDELLDGVRESDALIYPVHIDTNQPVPVNNQFKVPAGQRELAEKLSALAKTQLQKLADASGGRLYNAEHIGDIAKIYDQVAAEMRTVYSLAYTPTNTSLDGKLRSIKVKVNRPDTVARTRPGYYPR